eukprot:1154268-Pelagomonas_calceolata.AAC.2
MLSRWLAEAFWAQFCRRSKVSHWIALLIRPLGTHALPLPLDAHCSGAVDPAGASITGASNNCCRQHKCACAHLEVKIELRCIMWKG